MLEVVGARFLNAISLGFRKDASEEVQAAVLEE